MEGRSAWQKRVMRACLSQNRPSVWRFCWSMLQIDTLALDPPTKGGTGNRAACTVRWSIQNNKVAPSSASPAVCARQTTTTTTTTIARERHEEKERGRGEREREREVGTEGEERAMSALSLLKERRRVQEGLFSMEGCPHLSVLRRRPSVAQILCWTAT